MQEKDYKNYDYLDIIVKKDNACEIINAYSAFLWVKIDEKDDRHYSDVIHLTFKRDINIENKDRLNLLEVYYETALNKRAEIKIKKHSKSKIAICNLAFCSLATLFGVGVFIYFYKSILSIILATLFATLIFFIDFICIVKIKKKFANENQDYVKKIEQVNIYIKEILYNVDLITKKEQEKLGCDRGEYEKE